MDEADELELLAKALEDPVDPATQAQIAAVARSNPKFAETLRELLEARAGLAASAAEFVADPRFAFQPDDLSAVRREAQLQQWLADEAQVAGLHAAITAADDTTAEPVGDADKEAWRTVVAELRDTHENLERLGREIAAHRDFELADEQRERVRQAASQHRARWFSPSAIAAFFRSFGGAGRRSSRLSLQLAVGAIACVVLGGTIYLSRPRALRPDPLATASAPEIAAAPPTASAAWSTADTQVYADMDANRSRPYRQTERLTVSASANRTPTAAAYSTPAPASPASGNNHFSMRFEAPAKAPIRILAPTTFDRPATPASAAADKPALLDRPVKSSRVALDVVPSLPDDPVAAIRSRHARTVDNMEVASARPTALTMLVRVAGRLRGMDKPFAQRWDYTLEQRDGAWRVTSALTSFLHDRSSAAFEAQP